MSLKVTKGYNTSKFDTLELVPHAKNYGKPSKKASAKRALPTFTEEAHVSMNITSLDNEDGMPDSPKITNQSSIDMELEEHATKSTKFGTIDGVLGRCLLCMWGVIMFLRTGWIVGNAGIWQATLVMILSASVTMFTTLSLSAICTNGDVSHGGPYFLISRSLGPNLGGVIGLLFAFGNTIGVGLHLVGFAEAITSLYSKPFSFEGELFGKEVNFDIQIIAEVGLIILLLIALRGVGSIIKFNLVLLALMFISIIAFFVGAFIRTSDKESYGYTGFSAATFAANWNAAYMNNQSFMTMVAIFFPSVTGCMAGANISGDLKNPAVNIPVGTISAVLFSMMVYIMIAWMLGGCVERGMYDESGEVIPGFGLLGEYVIMTRLALWGPLVDIGIYASTFSSATSCFVAAPRIFKAVCDDGLFPIFNFFAVGRESDGEPVRCYFLVLIICLVINLTGDINFIAPMVTNFFLVTYALVNYSVFAWDISKSPGWRPTFKYYHPYLCLFATFQSIALMFLINWGYAVVTIAVGAICYKYIDSRNPNVNWGTTVESALYLKGCKIALKYQAMNTEHAKIARPTFLMMLYDENQNDVLTLFNLAKYINYSQGLIMIGHVLIGDINDCEVQNEYVSKRKNYLNYNLSPDVIKHCIMECCIAKSAQEGTKSIIQLAGMGAMQPNVFMIKIDQDIGHLKLDNSVDREEPLWFTNLTSAIYSGLGIIMVPKDFSLLNIINMHDEDDNIPPPATGPDGQRATNYIDIWWLFDDGGLTILTGYLLTKHKKFKDYKLRIMALDEIGFEDQTDMVHLVDRMRIDAEIVHVQSSDVDGLMTPKIPNAKSPSVQIVMQPDTPAAKKHNMESSEITEISKDSKVKSVQFSSEQSSFKYETGTSSKHSEHSKTHTNEISEMTKEEHTNDHSAADPTQSNETMKYLNEPSVDCTPMMEEKSETSRDEGLTSKKDNRRRRKVSEFAISKLAKYKRVGETIEKYSKEARLCLITMPYPRKKFEWWEFSHIIHDLTPKDVPSIFVRGTQDQVLTFAF